jgi:hypothetical protein
VRRILGACIRSNLETHGEDLAGFAIVSWDMRGTSHSSYFTENGPFSRSMLPAYVADALNRHLAVVMVQEGLASEQILPDDPA